MMKIIFPIPSSSSPPPPSALRTAMNYGVRAGLSERHAPCKRIQGCYEKLLNPDIHRLVELWYYLECKGWQRRAFKKVFKKLWSISRTNKKMKATPHHEMVCRTYVLNVLRVKYEPAALQYLSEADSTEMEEFRSTFAALHGISKRLPTTAYSSNYREYRRSESKQARPTVSRADDVERTCKDAWSAFRISNPNRAKSPEPVFVPQRPASAVPRGAPKASHPPYAQWFNPAEKPPAEPKAVFSTAFRTVLEAANERNVPNSARGVRDLSQRQKQLGNVFSDHTAAKAFRCFGTAFTTDNCQERTQGPPVTFLRNRPSSACAVRRN